ncbi:MAG: protein kinase [Alphaproteobacteria bacterium]|nr:protein kinase [Alphaproteobacteria bacterium]
MRERDTLLSTLPEEIRDDADKLIGTTEADPHEVVAELHRRGLLKDEQVRDAVLALEASLRVGRMRTRPPASAKPSILGPLGAGAMGEVLLAKDAGLNRVVAVKRLHPELAERKSVLERFYKEAQVTAQLDHPGIVPIHGLVQTDDGSLAYAMKLVRGRTLEDYLDEAREQCRKNGREDPEHALQARLEVFLHVCDAMAYAHERGVLHRDLKPENIMVGQFGQVMVMDWGIAKVMDGPADEPVEEGQETSPRKVHGTRVGAVMGTPRYMSPEQSEGRNDIIDGRSDQYTLGLILFEVVTLRPAVSPDLDLEGCLQWARTGRKQAMTHAYRGAVPRELVAIVDKATTLQRDRRYANVTELGNDIRRYLRDEAVLAKPDTILQRLTRWVGRHRSLMVTLLLMSLLALVVVSSTLVVTGMAVVEWRRRAAAAREERITAFLGDVGTKGADVDAAVRVVESVTTGLSFAAETSLDRPESDLELHYDPVQHAPPKTRKSEFYGREVSAERPSFEIVKGKSASDVGTDIERVAVLGYEFARVLVDATGRGAEEKLGRRQRLDVITRSGSPVVWAHVATSTGVLATFPGQDHAPRAGVDPQKLPWVADAAKKGLSWTSPAVDAAGQGVVMTVSLPLWSRGQDLLGVAGATMSLDTLADAVKLPDGATAAYLVDEGGKKVVWPGMNAHKLTKFDPEKVDTGLLLAIKRHPDGWREVGSTLQAWTAIPALGWTFVAETPN